MRHTTLPRPGSRWTQVVKAAMSTRQFEYIGRDGKGHPRLRHLITGTVLTYSTHSGGDKHAPRNFAKQVEQLTGQQVWPRGPRKPGSK